MRQPKVNPLRLGPRQASEIASLSTTAKKAVEIAKIYLKRKYPAGSLIKPKKGADLAIRTNGRRIDFEVKGTLDESIALDKLKVSSKASHDLLRSGIKVLRIMDVRARTPKVAEMKCGVHFRLKREPRWRAAK